MNKPETLEELYTRRFEWIPEQLGQNIGHLNVFRLPHSPGKPIPYRRRDYFKVTLCVGASRIHYADKVLEVKKQALVFSNPFIPYKWEHLEDVIDGFYVIFNQRFFNQFGNVNQYEVFQPNGNHVFELDDDQVKQVSGVYERMFEEIESDYIHKYDLLRNMVYELLHFAMKTQAATTSIGLHINASQRIYWLFLELLERQFPIDDDHPQIELRSASDFANHLNVHVNHLNRAVKESSGKSTSVLIGERIFRESKIMLKQSQWNVSEIAYALNFKEATHFNNFFKKHAAVSPTVFRNN
ncbi:helix-turn-helix domain-containing protein [Marinilongibacter aquaticus]|uniref:helix-turn-helix domain-containing protein n=1 Tax=Marinilongibacter aquaticus TaxID=2975157 RepID=UPI0021BDB348|nr:helix-turn-helix domain-containing protein [Marinilongibacter aquaticus]UBM60221.1 helix-turn-helix domain-containing protein [Marinilongibacter aquaticus]